MIPPRAVIALAAVLFLAWLGSHDLWAPDEPYFAEGAREMLVDGEIAVPHVNGVVTTDKPPLFFWLIALASLPLGEVTSWTARLPSALAALGTLALTMSLARRFHGPRTAALTGTVLATTYLFWDKARWSQTDSVLCLLIWCALTSFALFRAGVMDGARAGLLFWAATALAVLDKGPVGLLLPLGISLTVLGVDRNLGLWRRFAPFRGPLLFALIVGAWIAVATYGGGGEYSVWSALREHFIERGIHGYHHKQPFYYFFEVLPVVLMPWSALVPGALVLAWSRRSPFDRFLLTAVLFVILFFTISTEKRELYALPAVPAFAMMIGSFGGRLAEWREPDGPPIQISRRWGTIPMGVLGTIFVGLAFAAPVLREEVPFVPQWIAFAVSVLMLITGAGVLFTARRGALLPSMVITATGVATFYLFSVSSIYPLYEPIKSARSFSQVLEKETRDARAAGGEVLSYGLDNLPEHFAFYTGGVYTVETDDPSAVERHLSRPETAYAVMDGARIGELSIRLRNRLETVHESVLARRLVVLVKNGGT